MNIKLLEYHVNYSNYSKTLLRNYRRSLQINLNTLQLSILILPRPEILS